MLVRRKRPWLAVALSLLCPGIGHFYLEEDGVGAYLFFVAYLGFLASLPVMLLEWWMVGLFAPWVFLAWAVILALGAADAYRLALRYNRYAGPSREPRKHIDFVDSANAPITRTSLRLR